MKDNMNEITIENYTDHCLQTWGGKNQKERAELGIAGEFGEMCECQKKFLRGDFNEEERNKRMLKELGDCFYYLAIHSFLQKDNRFVVFSQDFNEKFKFEYDVTVALTLKAETYMCKCFAVLKALNFNLEEVLQANIDKLRSRAERNKIKGDGDER